MLMVQHQETERGVRSIKKGTSGNVLVAMSRAGKLLT